MSKQPFTLYQEKQNRFRVFVLRDDQRPIAEALTSDESRDTDNGAYIVKCLNAYPALVSALEELLFASNQPYGYDKYPDAVEQAREALKQAKEREQ